MHSLEKITALRRRGYRPRHVVFTDLAVQPTEVEYVRYGREDTPELADLRVLVGLFVTIEGPDAAVVARWAAAAMKAGAATVLGHVYTRALAEEKHRQVSTTYRLAGVDA